MKKEFYDSAPLGIANEENDDIRATVSEFSGAGAEAGLPEEERFIAGVAQLVLRRVAESEASDKTDAADIAIFILSPSPPESLDNLIWEPMLDNGRTEVVGRLWFTAAAVVSAHGVELPKDTDDAVRFSFVTSIPALGSLPTVIYDPRPVSQWLRWYPEGLSMPDNVEVKSIDAEVSPSEVFEVIEQLHQECFVTPDGLPPGTHLWRNSAKQWPRKDAEAMMQSQLKAGLVVKFPFCKIRHEQPNKAGRTDLEIEKPDRSRFNSFAHHALLELKILRSYWSTGSPVSNKETTDWIREGVRQAVAYRREIGGHWSALCCFDMRKNDKGDDDTFDHVRESARELDVVLWRWFLFASSDDYRQATTPV